MNFDEKIDRRGTNSKKWDGMQDATGVSPVDGIAMWIADMDFRAPECIQSAVTALHEQANYGYFTGFPAYKNSVVWWMNTRHKWAVDPDWIFTTYGLGNAIGLTLQTFTEPGDKVALITPVYHEFAALIRAGKRQVVECELLNENGTYTFDLDRWQAQLSGDEKVILFCSPHNPAGRVWSARELRDFAQFCARNDLLIVSDDIHHDLIYAGNAYVPLPIAAPEISDRLIMLTAASKTFNIAGTRTGNVVIPDPILRQKFKSCIEALSIAPNLFGIAITQAGYSRQGAEWVDALMVYLDGNRRLFDDGIHGIPGLASMPMQATYLAWVDFSDTGMDMAEVNKRVAKVAKIGTTPGRALGAGGKTFLRFNIGTQRAIIAQAIDRLHAAFSDLQ